MLRIFFILMLISVNALSQTVYLTSTDEPCYAQNTPAAKITFKANVQQQKVIFTIESITDKEILNLAENNCTVIDKDNWNCEKSFASDGNAFKRKIENDGYHYCYFNKKILGGWELIRTSKESSNEIEQFELGKKIGAYLSANLKADMLKNGVCEKFIKQLNPNFFSKNHFSDAIAFARKKYSSNPEIQKQLSQSNMADFAKSTASVIESTLQSELGSNPSVTQCGYVSGAIDKQISNNLSKIK